MSHNRDLSAVAAQLGFHSSNIGIGTDNPGNKLEVNSGTDNEGIKVVSTDAGSYITVLLIIVLQDQLVLVLLVMTSKLM